MKFIERHFANKKLKQIETAVQSGRFADLAIACDINLDDPIFSEMPINEFFQVVEVRLADRIRQITKINGGQK